MATTLELPKDQLIQHALKQMKSSLGDNTWTDPILILDRKSVV